MLKKAIDLLKEHEPDIRDRVRDNTAWLWQKLAIDERVSDKVITVAEDTLREIGADPAHPWRLSFRSQGHGVCRRVADLRGLSRAGRGNPGAPAAISPERLPLRAVGRIRQGIIDDARSGASVFYGRLVELSASSPTGSNATRRYASG